MSIQGSAWTTYFGDSCHYSYSLTCASGNGMYETLSLSTGATYAETKTYTYKNHTYRFTLNEQPGTSITAYIYIDGSKLTGSGQYLTARSNGTNGCAGNEYAAITDNAGGSVVYMLK